MTSVIFSLLLIAFFNISSISSNQCDFGLTLFEEKIGGKPTTVAFSDGSFFVINVENGDADIETDFSISYFFYDDNEEKEIFKSSFSIKGANQITYYSVTQGFYIEEKTEKKAFFLIVSYYMSSTISPSLKILRVRYLEEQEEFGSVEVYKKEYSAESISHPRIAFVRNDFEQNEYFAAVWEKEKQGTSGQEFGFEAFFFTYSLNNEILLTTVSIGDNFFPNSFSSFKRIPAISSSDEIIMIAFNEDENHFQFGLFKESELATPNYNKTGISTNMQNSNLEVKGKGSVFAGTVTDQNSQFHAFSFEVSKVDETFKYYKYNGIETRVFNADVEILSVSGGIGLFFQSTTSSNTPKTNLYYMILNKNDKYSNYILDYSRTYKNQYDNFNNLKMTALHSNKKIIVTYTKNEFIEGEVIDCEYVRDLCEGYIENSIGKCVCKQGYSQTIESMACQECEQNYYKNFIGNDQCILCTGTTNQESGATQCNIEHSNPGLSTEGRIIGVISIVFVLILVCSFTIFIIIIVIFSIIYMQSRKKANRFDHIEGVDMILKEAELDQQEKVERLPRIKVSKLKYIIDFKEIKIIEKIGEGASNSMVYRCDWNGTDCAFKGFSEGSSVVGSDESTFNEFEKEVEICVGLNHPSILQFYGASITPKRIGLLLQFCVNGDLKSFLTQYQKKNNGKKYDVMEKLRILKEIVSGMKYLHNRKLIHRDLKPENILLDENQKVKIMDFGLSRTINTLEDKTMTKMIGTVFYMSPEVIEGKNYAFTCDIYSWAILTNVIISENWFPYGEKISQAAIMGKIKIDPNYRPEITKDAYERIEFLIPIIQKCWKFNPEERYSFNELEKIFIEESENKKSIYEI